MTTLNTVNKMYQLESIRILPVILSIALTFPVV